MPIDEAVRLLHVAFNAVVLWLLWHYPWRRSCQFRYRQKLFEVRDQLFDFARSGQIDFTDPAYVALRSYINSMIRFSNAISVTRLATFIVFWRYLGDSPRTRPSLADTLSQVADGSVKLELCSIRQSVEGHTIKHLMFSSPHVLLAGPPLLALYHYISKKPARQRPPAQSINPAVELIEVQARDAYGSAAIERLHEHELAAV